MLVCALQNESIDKKKKRKSEREQMDRMRGTRAIFAVYCRLFNSVIFVTKTLFVLTILFFVVVDDVFVVFVVVELFVSYMNSSSILLPIIFFIFMFRLFLTDIHIHTHFSSREFLFAIFIYNVMEYVIRNWGRHWNESLVLLLLAFT